MYNIQIYHINNKLTYKLICTLNFYHQSIATEYYKLCNTRINKDSTKYISSFIDEYIKLQELQKNCIWNKNNYSMNIDLITSEETKILFNVSITSDKNIEVITSEYINVLNRHKIMIKLFCNSSYNIENILCV
jgi:hypothetical protein